MYFFIFFLAFQVVVLNMRCDLFAHLQDQSLSYYVRVFRQFVPKTKQSKAKSVEAYGDFSSRF